MPKLNTNNQKVIDYLLGVCEMWVKEYDIDGLRLDVAYCLTPDFLRQLRNYTNGLKEDPHI